MTKRLLVPACLILSVTASAEFSFTPLRLQAASPFPSLGTAVSSNGGVVVGYSVTDVNDAGTPAGQSAWKATKVNGVWTLQVLGDFPEDPAQPDISAPNVISGDGTLIGGFGWGDFPEGFVGRNAVWSGGILSTRPINATGSTFSAVTGLNLNGAIATGYTQSGGNVQGYRWNGTATELLVGPNTYVRPYAMNDSGSIVVGQTGTRLPFRWTAGSGANVFSIPPGTDVGLMRAVDAAGYIAAGYAAPNSNPINGRVPVRWTNNWPQRLPLPTQFIGGEAQAISSDGQVVAGIFRDGIHNAAMVWTSMAGSFDLTEYLELNGVDLQGYLPTRIFDISADGRTIVGEALRPTDETAEAFVATIDLPSNGIAALTLSAKTVRGGMPLTGTVTLTHAQDTDAVLNLRAKPNSASVPATITVPAGSTSAKFTVQTAREEQATDGFVEVDFNGIAWSYSFQVLPPVVHSLTLTPNEVYGGQTSRAVVLLNGRAPEGGTSFTISDNSLAVSAPSSVRLAQGNQSGVFTVSTLTVSAAATRQVTVTGTYGTATASLTLKPAPPLSSLTVQPSTVKGGEQSTGTVAMSAALPASATIALSDNSGSITVPASVTVAAGSSQSTFPVTTSRVTATATRQVVASYAGVTRTAPVTLTP